MVHQFSQVVSGNTLPCSNAVSLSAGCAKVRRAFARSTRNTLRLKSYVRISHHQRRHDMLKSNALGGTKVGTSAPRIESAAQKQNGAWDCTTKIERSLLPKRFAKSAGAAAATMVGSAKLI